MNPYINPKDTRRKGMTHNDALILVAAIRESKAYKYVANEMKAIELKVKHGMILYKSESDKLQALYRKVQEMGERQYSKVIV